MIVPLLSLVAILFGIVTGNNSPQQSQAPHHNRHPQQHGQYAPYAQYGAQPQFGQSHGQMGPQVAYGNQFGQPQNQFGPQGQFRQFRGPANRQGYYTAPYPDADVGYGIPYGMSMQQNYAAIPRMTCAGHCQQQQQQQQQQPPFQHDTPYGSVSSSSSSFYGNMGGYGNHQAADDTFMNGNGAVGDITAQVRSYKDLVDRVSRTAVQILQASGNGATVAMQSLSPVVPAGLHPNNSPVLDYIHRHLVVDPRTGRAPIDAFVQHLLARVRDFLARQPALLAAVDAAHVDERTHVQLGDRVQSAGERLMKVERRLATKLRQIQNGSHSHATHNGGPLPMTKKQRKAHRRAMRLANHGHASIPPAVAVAPMMAPAGQGHGHFGAPPPNMAHF